MKKLCLSYHLSLVITIMTGQSLKEKVSTGFQYNRQLRQMMMPYLKHFRMEW